MTRFNYIKDWKSYTPAMFDKPKRRRVSPEKNKPKVKPPAEKPKNLKSVKWRNEAVNRWASINNEKPGEF
jgi:hypothetical protein